MIDPTHSSFSVHPLLILMDPDYRRLNDALLGFLLRSMCLQALYGSVPEDPVELGRLLGMRPTSAGKSLAQVRHFFKNFEELSPNLQKDFLAISRTFPGDFGKTSGNLVLESLLRERTEAALYSNQDKRGAACGNPSKASARAISTPRTLDDEAGEEREVLYTSISSSRGQGDSSSSSSSASSPSSSPSFPLEPGVEEVEFDRSFSSSRAKPRRSKAKEATATHPVEAFDLEAAAGKHLPVIQQVIGLFGPGNVEVVTDVPRMVTLFDSGKVTPEGLLKAAKSLRSQRSGLRYMGKFSKFLDSGSYLVCADANDSTPTTSEVPAHRQAAEEASRGQWEGRL